MAEGIMDWLVEVSDPTVRYLALRDLLHADEGVVESARKAIMSAGPVPRMLSKQDPQGCWGRPEDFYIRSKYRGTVWSLILLAELYADASDDRVRKACEFVLRWSQERASGGFSYIGSAEKGGRRGSVIPCLTANMVFSLVRMGYLEDDRTAHALEWLTRYMRFELHPGIPREWPYLHDRCWRDHTCRSAAVKALKALAEVPRPKRTADMKRTIEAGAEFLLSQRIFYKGPNSAEVARPDWLRLGFPLMWNSDILEILDVLTRLGFQDERMHDAILVLLSKKGHDGRWQQENRFEGRFLVPQERNGKPSKWVTLRALRVLEAMPR